MPVLPPPLTINDVTAIAALSRLKLSEEEITHTAKQLGDVLGHFAAIQQITTSDVPSADAVSGRSNIARVDEVATEALCTTDALLAAAPAMHGRQLKVPAVFE